MVCSARERGGGERLEGGGIRGWEAIREMRRGVGRGGEGGREDDAPPTSANAKSSIIMSFEWGGVCVWV